MFVPLRLFVASHWRREAEEMAVGVPVRVKMWRELGIVSLTSVSKRDVGNSRNLLEIISPPCVAEW